MHREPIFNIPAVVVAVTASFVAVHIFRSLLDPNTALWWLLALSFIPARYGETNIYIPGGDVSDFTSVITYMFVHGDWLHLTVNSVWMLAFGSAIAKRIGAGGFLLFSALCGIGGLAAHLIGHWDTYNPVLGASAAISGQMAGAMRFFFGASKVGRMRDIREDPRSVPLISIAEAFQEPRFLLFFAIWVGVNILFGFGAVSFGQTEAIAWEAHIGGFLTGLLLFQWFDRPYPVNGNAS